MNTIFTRINRLIVVCASLLCLPSASGMLKVGDTAPTAMAATWVHGQKVTDFEGDKVYLVEFWATWCGPCVAAIPHINDLHLKCKDQGLVVMGQSVWERATIEEMRLFVANRGSIMSYRVAMDDQSNTMAKEWLEAAGQEGIPSAFLVTKGGKIAFVGHPNVIEETLVETLLKEPDITKPRIAVQQPIGSNLISGKAGKSFGTVKIRKKSTAKTFTIKNTGTANLTNLAVSLGGGMPSDYLITQPKLKNLTPGISTTFKVSFRPTATGSRNATLKIKSNDSATNPFVVKLSGLGVKR